METPLKLCKPPLLPARHIFCWEYKANFLIKVLKGTLSDEKKSEMIKVNPFSPNSY